MNLNHSSIAGMLRKEEGEMSAVPALFGALLATATVLSLIAVPFGCATGGRVAGVTGVNLAPADVTIYIDGMG